MPSLSVRIREFRLELGLSQSALAGVLFMRQATVSDWETAKVKPTRGRLRLVADLVQDSRKVFDWLENGGERPRLIRRVQQGANPGTSVGTLPGRSWGGLPAVPPAPQGPNEAAEALGYYREAYAVYVRDLAGLVAKGGTVPAHYLLEVAVWVLRTFEACYGSEIEGRSEGDAAGGAGNPRGESTQD